MKFVLQIFSICFLQPSYLLSLTVEPSLFEKIFTFLDHRSVASLELTCPLLRDVVIQTRVYRRMFRQLVEETLAEQFCEEELLQEMSCFYKNKLFQHFHRYTVRQEIICCYFKPWSIIIIMVLISALESVNCN